jgi:acyl carrier protein
MAMDDVLRQLIEVFQEVFGDDSLHISRATTAADIEGWDSVMHVTLIVRVEKAFGIRFSSSEVAALQNVGELVDLIQRRRAASTRGKA